MISEHKIKIKLPFKQHPFYVTTGSRPSIHRYIKDPQQPYST
jgi:hypothetical protein